MTLRMILSNICGAYSVYMNGKALKEDESELLNKYGDKRVMLVKSAKLNNPMFSDKTEIIIII